MFKKFLLGIIAVSAIVMLWTEANAQDCVRWRRVGGSNTCVEWSTGSVQVEVQFRQDCGPEGLGCEADVEVETTNSVVFCQNPTTLAIRKSSIPCTALVTFGGPVDQCEPKHEEDFTTDGGVGHEAGHKCTARTEFPPLNPEVCQSSCTGAEVVVDVTPIEMDTRTFLFVGSGSVDGLITQQAEGSSPECDPNSSFCEIDQHCTIDPKRIQFDAIRSYQCEITSVNGGDSE
jgi:hypothetical protein